MLFSELPEVIIDLNNEAQLLFNSETLTVLSGSEMFKDKKFNQEVNIDGAMKSQRFTVQSVVHDPNQLHINDIFCCHCCSQQVH